jgi:hypothetical protein
VKGLEWGPDPGCDHNKIRIEHTRGLTDPEGEEMEGDGEFRILGHINYLMQASNVFY